MKQIRARYAEVLEELAQEREQMRPARYQEPAPALKAEAIARLRAAETELIEASELSESVVSALINHIETADDLDLYRIQVRPLACQWGISERALLLACLYATRAGVLELSWDVVCPHCRGVRHEAASLGDVSARGECEVCNIDFSTAAENAVEITFRVHSSIREVPKLFFCSAEPATKTHIRVQQRLAPGEIRELEPGLESGLYRVRFGQGATHLVEVTDQADTDRVSIQLGSETQHSCQPRSSIRIENTTEEAGLVIVEACSWAEVALRPGDLFTVPEFRDLFSEQYLAADVQLHIGHQTVLFTDIVGSTLFYAKKGDPEAFSAVKRHFERVFSIVEREGGAIVKTIGDAAMAAFASPLAAVRAARAIQAEFGPAAETPLRISLHSGPCIGVNLNTGLDLFGATVNTAAKLQAYVGAGEIVLSESVLGAAGVDEFLRAEEAQLRHGSHAPEGIEAIFYRIWDASSSPVKTSCASPSERSAKLASENER